ncbi:MAG TPA: hypothetical protein VJT82_03470, partial [Pyrinomonadaceae bacterium]|nr:hypothetical protein [Pyrinomonadaceae bacterium]
LTTATAQAVARDDVYNISYQLSMSNPASHLFEVSITVETPKDVDAVDFQMPRWSPGRYAVFEFAKNVQEFRGGGCAPGERCDAAALTVTRLDTQTWRVFPRGAKRVTVGYKVFANDLSGTFSQLDERHANFNGGALFMYVVGHKPDPVRLSIAPPANWRIINAATERADQREWQFPNYDIMIDTPTEIAPDFTVDEFKVDGKTYRVMVHSFGDEKGKRAALVSNIEKIVRAETSLMGTPDYASYTFLMHFDPTAPRGDGMEHLASTQIITRHPLGNEGVLEDATDTAAHEFFHAWNVKRLRPVELGPWDFTRPVNTRSLWIAEGLTNYYGCVMQRRAGIWTDERFERELAAAIADVENAPGSRLMSAEEASLVSSLMDRAQSVQQTNMRETSISYYTKGEVIGIVLDLIIRGKTGGRASLDDVMRRMYEEFYLKSPNASYYLRGRGYTGADFERMASQVAGADLSDFFARYVRGVEPLPYDEALAYVGLRLVKSTPTAAPPNGTQPPNTTQTSNATQQPQRTRYDYRLEEIKDAPAQARALRAAWLKG